MAMPRRAMRPTLLESDAASIAAAIELVGKGLADSVTLVGLRFGERLLASAVAGGRDAGVTVTRMPGSSRGAITFRRRTD